MSMPKSGSHLVDNCIRLLLNKQLKSVTHSKNVFSNPKYKDHLYVLKHFNESEVKNDILIKTSKVIVNIRDPRDICVSFYNRNIIPCTYSSSPQQWINLSEGMKLMHYIKDNKSTFCISKQATIAIDIIKNHPNILVTRFENLVGSQGGGSDVAQEEEIRKIADYLEIPLTQKKLEYVISNMYGKSITFKKGKIGTWKHKFKEQHINTFDRRLGQYLKSFGYE